MPNTVDGVNFIVYHNPNAGHRMFLRSLTCQALSRTSEPLHVTHSFTKSCIHCHDGSMDHEPLNQVIRVVTNIDKNKFCHAHFCGLPSEVREVFNVMAARAWSKEQPPWWILSRNRISNTDLRVLFAKADADILVMAPRGI